MKPPRFLPLLAVAVGGVLAVRAVTGMADVPNLLAGAKAWAEEAAPAVKATDKDKDKDKSQSALPANAGLAVAKPAPQACAPTAAELARQAGLSPAELQVLQSLGARRGELDQREQGLDVQLALMAAAEAKLDAKLKTMAGIKTDIQGLLGQAEASKQAEQDRLVRVYETMKPKDAAARMTILSDAVRLPIAAKMKDRALSAVLAQMPPVEAKALTEKLSNRLAAAEEARQRAKDAETAQAAPPTPAAQAPRPQVKAPPRPQARPRPKAQIKTPDKPQAIAQAPVAKPVVPAAPATPAAKPAPAAAPAAPAG